MFAEKLEYHIWNETSKFLLTNPMVDESLNMTCDKIVFHDTVWRKESRLIRDLDRIIICCENSNNVKLGLEMLRLIPEIPIHIYNRYGRELDMLIDNERITFFGDKDDLVTEDIIIKESLRRTAKSIHSHYSVAYGDDTPWQELSGFYIKSNLSAANYFNVITRLYEEGMSIDQLTELEHIRWCRFHYGYHWSYGKIKDKIKRTHPCLIPFNELSLKEINKDRENVILALSLRGKIENE